MAVASVGIMAALCAGMFAVTVFQLVLRAISGHRLRSHFTACMVMCSVWALLRAAMMSLYTRHDTATSVSTMTEYLILLVLPYALQFAILSTMVLYYSEVSSYPAQKWRREESLCATPSASFGSHAWLQIGSRTITCMPRPTLILLMRSICIVCNILFLGLNIFFVVADEDERHPEKHILRYQLRVLFPELFNVVVDILIVLTILQIRSLVRAKRIIEHSRGPTVEKMLRFAGCLFPIYFSRFVYNMYVVVTANPQLFSFRWQYLPNYERDLSSHDIIVLAWLLFIWEILPLGIFVWYFWVPIREKPNVNDLPINTPQTVVFEEEDEDADRNRRLTDDTPLIGFGGISYGAVEH
eukprot:m.60027 g.60027  ORF g.60027 m.60027 type:complete len:354 (-) comp7255_c0_seq2:80-1141(-)